MNDPQIRVHVYRFDYYIFQFQYNIMPGTGRNILVTGGGGYIGSHCILQLLQEDFNVIAVDNFVNSIKGMPKNM